MTDPKRTPRISPKVRTAIELRVQKGLSITAAAEEAGLSRFGLSKALKRPAVADLLAETQTRFLSEVNNKRAILRARALDIAADMLNSEETDDKVKLKLIEMLMADGKAPAVAVHVDASTNIGGGYEFVRPGARVIEIKDKPQDGECFWLTRGLRALAVCRRDS